MNFIKSIWMAVALLVLGASLSHAQVGPNQTVQLYNGYADTCLAVNSVKQSAAVNITTATTTQLIAPVTGKAATICGFYSTTANAGATLVFNTGTGSTCATGTTVLTGTMLTSSSGRFDLLGSGQKLKSAVGGGICVITAGTTPGIQGFVVFTQR